MTAVRPDEHVLTYQEDEDDKGYGDGLDDVYRCACGEAFQANGDIQAAFDHGIEVGKKLGKAEVADAERWLKGGSA